MTDRQALDKALKAIWQYAQEHDEAYVRLMMAIREVDSAIFADNTLPPLKLAPDFDKDDKNRE